ncbi:hypothetical protein [Streptomyces wuyuanensis]
MQHHPNREPQPGIRFGTGLGDAEAAVLPIVRPAVAASLIDRH